MTSRIIVAIVAVFAAVLSFAAPVAVDAQTPTLTVAVNLFGNLRIDYSGFQGTGTAYYAGYCWHVSASPASCTFNSMGELANGFCYSDPAKGADVPLTTGTFWDLSGMATGTEAAPYQRYVAYTDTNCQTAVASVAVTRPTTLPTWNVRDITHDSATIYIEEAFSTHGVGYWAYVLTPGGVCTSVNAVGYPIVEAPTGMTAGLSPGTSYRYTIFPGWPCSSAPSHFSPVTSLTFSTEGTGPPLPTPDPPSGVDGGEPTTAVNGGSVTLSWSNPGDPDIASYEYSIRQAGGPAGEWTTIPGSNADTTSVTIDLATGEARAVNNATPPMVEWTIHLRARDVNGNAGGIFTTTVNAAGAGTVVPALPLAGVATLALLLFLGGQRRRNG